MPKFRIFDKFPFPAVGTKWPRHPSKSAPAEDIQVPEKYRLEYLSVISGTNDIPTATVKVAFDGQVASEVGMGEMAFAAICDAISKAVNQVITIEWYSSPSICRGLNDTLELRLRLWQHGAAAMGYGSARDYNEASARALIDGLNRLAALPGTTPTQQDMGGGAKRLKPRTVAVLYPGS